MLIDLVFLVLLLMAVFKGISKGFIVAAFSLMAFIVGLAAALKLSAVVALYLKDAMNVTGFWLPFLSFLLVFVGVVFLIRLGASLLKKAAGMVFLGWIDTVAGIILYAVMYLLVYSVILFFATKTRLISIDAQNASRTYSYIQPFGPKVMTGFGKVIPFFSSMFEELNQFFEGVSQKR